MYRQLSEQKPQEKIPLLFHTIAKDINSKYHLQICHSSLDFTTAITVKLSFGSKSTKKAW